MIKIRVMGFKIIYSISIYKFVNHIGFGVSHRVYEKHEEIWRKLKEKGRISCNYMKYNEIQIFKNEP